MATSGSLACGDDTGETDPHNDTTGTTTNTATTNTTTTTTTTGATTTTTTGTTTTTTTTNTGTGTNTETNTDTTTTNTDTTTETDTSTDTTTTTTSTGTTTTSTGDGCDDGCFECGNGILEGREECDDGDLESGDGCDENCILECGNGVVEDDEECDDGDHDNGDGCDLNCLIEECGNDRLEGDEECDEGDTDNGDGCNQFCQNDCGDGEIDAGEECDDGNEDDGDWCSSTCLETMVSVYAGGSMTCSALATGDAMCWGQNSSGQLGVASFSATAHGDEAGEEPGVANTYVTRPSEALTITQMSIGSSHACAILSDGDLYCWGSNVNGQLGVGDNISTDSMSTPVDLGDVEVIDVAAGGNHTCALLTNGDVWCWGLDSSGELGDGANDPQNAPTVAVDFADVAATKIVTGLAHSCALLESNAVYCWGDNSSGQLGDNNGGVDSNVPSGVTLAMGDVLDLDAGGLFTCAIVGTNVYCWGENGSGQLGNNDGTNTDLDVPSAALDIDGETPVKLALGGEHGCVLTSTGKVYCWGESDAGQTGQNDVTDDLAPLLVTTTGFTVTDIAAGNDHVCVILLPDDVDDLSRHIRCWGESGVGQLGLGGISDIGDDEVVDNASYDVDVVSTEPVP